MLSLVKKNLRVYSSLFPGWGGRVGVHKLWARILKSFKNRWKVNPPTLTPGSEDTQVLQKPMENQSSNPGARVGGFPSLAKTTGKSILRPWPQGRWMPKSYKNRWKINPPTLAPGSEDYQVLHKTMENQSSNPGPKVGGYPSPPKSDGKSILQPWRQGRRIPKSCKNRWKINRPTLALGSEDAQVLQKLMENLSSNPGTRVEGCPSLAKTDEK